MFRNFSGKEGPYNVAGDREFAVVLDAENAVILEADGWNVKYLMPRDNDEPKEDPKPYLPVKVNFKVRPPTVVMITSNARTRLDEDSIGALDWADIKYVDLIVTPYNWVYGAKTGTKAYLKSLYVTIEEDDLALKYAEEGGD
jgi:hypothetical protein